MIAHTNVCVVFMYVFPVSHIGFPVFLYTFAPRFARALTLHYYSANDSHLRWPKFTLQTRCHLGGWRGGWFDSKRRSLHIFQYFIYCCLCLRVLKRRPLSEFNQILFIVLFMVEGNCILLIKHSPAMKSRVLCPSQSRGPRVALEQSGMPNTPSKYLAPQPVETNQNVAAAESAGESTIDAMHIHFRERLGPQQTYHCHTCDDRFQANSLLAVMDHFVRHDRSKCPSFYSACLYCGGKVHSYCLETRRDGAVVTDGDADDVKGGWMAVEPGTAGGGRRYYHDCVRWRTGLDT